MNQNQMIENLKELSAALWHGEDDTITTLTMWADSLDKAIETLERIRWRKVEEEIPKARRRGYPVDVLTFAVADDGKDKYISDSRYYGDIQIRGVTLAEYTLPTGRICRNRRRRKNDDIRRTLYGVYELPVEKHRRM